MYVIMCTLALIFFKICVFMKNLGKGLLVVFFDTPEQKKAHNSVRLRLQGN